MATNAQKITAAITAAAGAREYLQKFRDQLDDVTTALPEYGENDSQMDYADSAAAFAMDADKATREADEQLDLLTKTLKDLRDEQERVDQEEGNG